MEFPKEKCGTVVADPPWRYENTSSRGAAEDHYQTLPTAKLMCMPVEQLALPDAHLYLWTTDSHLEDALLLTKAWGFEYKLTLVWVKASQTKLDVMKGLLDLVGTPQLDEPFIPKVQIGLGNYFRHAHELCLFGTRGSAPAADRGLPSVLFAPRGRHSSKPELLQDLAEKLSPGPFLELFARRQRPGWTCWGMEAV